MPKTEIAWGPARLLSDRLVSTFGLKLDIRIVLSPSVGHFSPNFATFICWRGYCYFDSIADRSAVYCATFMKLKIAGLFRSLLGKTDNSQPEKNSAPASPVATPSTTPAQLQSEQAYASPNCYPSQSPSTPDPDHPDEIGIPLAAIANSLPMDLK